MDKTKSVSEKLLDVAIILSSTKFDKSGTLKIGYTNTKVFLYSDIVPLVSKTLNSCGIVFKLNVVGIDVVEKDLTVTSKVEKNQSIDELKRILLTIIRYRMQFINAQDKNDYIEYDWVQMIKGADDFSCGKARAYAQREFFKSQFLIHDDADDGNIVEAKKKEISEEEYSQILKKISDLKTKNDFNNFLNSLDVKFKDDARIYKYIEEQKDLVKYITSLALRIKDCSNLEQLKEIYAEVGSKYKDLLKKDTIKSWFDSKKKELMLSDNIEVIENEH